MRVRAIQDLAQLNDKNFLAEVECGSSLCLANATKIHQDCLALAEQKRPRGTEILRLAAEEEAAKVLILLDAVRCPRTQKAEFTRQLQYFNDHLAKGIYAQYCGFKPATFGEIRRWIKAERKEYYLDGPNGVDWIFYNNILRAREELIYVDYVESDGKHLWLDPVRYDELGTSLFMPPRSAVLRLVNALNDLGCLASGALQTIADIWRPISFSDESTWSELRECNHETLRAMHAEGFLVSNDAEAVSVVVNEWLFPLCSLDLQIERVKKESLREIQARWSPEV